jgi:hypothetical protein
MTTIVKAKEFTFDEKRHRYELDGKPLTGVTTILSVIAKPSLIQWAADETAKHLGWVNPKYETPDIENLVLPTDKQEYFDRLCEARVQHAKRKEKAGDIGTLAHKHIENIVIEAIKNGGYINGDNPINVPLDGTVATMVSHFVKWALDNNVKFIESEKRLFSEKHWFAGTCDLVFEMEGKRYIGDIKTSSAIYNEHFFQMGGYEIALEEMGYSKVDGYLVINLKKDGKFDLKMAQNTEINKQAFLHALGLYKIINSLE